MSCVAATKNFLQEIQSLNDEEVTCVKKFIDEYTTVSSHEGTDGREVAKIAREVNKHHHTKTCRKCNSKCCFIYPKFPAPHTIVVQPCQVNDKEERGALLAKYQELLRKVKAVLEDEDKINDMITKYDKQSESKEEYKENIEKRTKEVVSMAGVDYDDYLKALGTSKSGYSVVQQRDLDEIFINSYNRE